MNGNTRRAVAWIAAAVLVAACSGDSTSPNPGSIGVAVTGSPVTVMQGQSGTVNVTVSRVAPFSGPVALTLEGAPTGVTPTFDPASVPGAATTSTLALAVAATTTPGTYPLTLRAKGAGVADATVPVSLVVAAAAPPSFGMTLDPTSLSVAQGTNGTSTVTLTRANGFTGGVTLAVSGAPAGVTVTAPTGAVTGNTATITVAASSTAAAGTYQLTVTGTGTGVANQTATLSLTVTAAQTGSFTLVLAPTTLSIAQGASASSTATLTRAGGFAGAVALAVTGQPAGMTVTLNPSTGTTGNSVTINVATTTSVAAGTYPLTVTGTGTGVATKTATLSVTVTAAQTGSIALALSPTSVSVAQGGANATSTVTITRAGGFTGAVGLAVTGAPAGVTATVSPTSATGTTATVTVSASSAAAVGSYSLTVTGTGTNVATKTATLTVNVTGGTQQSATFAFCTDNVPAWFAVQDGPSAAWTRVTPTGTNFTFHFTATKVGIAYATSATTTSGSDLTVLYATAAELQGVSGTTNVACTTGGKTVNGSVANVGTSELATIALASSTASVSGAGGVNTFQLTGLPQGAHDLIASRSTISISGSSISYVLNKLIIRRGLDPANGSTLPVLDFNASEAFAPATANLTVGNLGSDQALEEIGLTTANGTSASFFFSSPSTATTVPYYGVPDAKLAAGDLHSLTVFAFPAGSSPTTSRFATLYARSVANHTVTLGPTLGTPTITTVATSPYLRLRAQLAQQSAYNSLGGIVYTQGTGASERTVNVLMTAAYAGSGGYDLTIPDLSGVSGWNNAWALQPAVSTTWTAIEAGGSFNSFFPGAKPTDGATVVFATRNGTIASP